MAPSRACWARPAACCAPVPKPSTPSQAAGQDNSSYRQDLSDLVSNINQNRPNGQEILDTVAQLNRKGSHARLDQGPDRPGQGL